MLQCLGVYLVGSWVALQVVDVLKDNMGLPDWVFPFAVVLLVLGLPIVLATAVVQERLPGTAPDAGSPQRIPEPGEFAVRRAARAPESVHAHEKAPTRAAGTDDGLPGRALLTWRNALAGGALAFLLLLVITSGFMFMRSNGIGPAGTLVAKGVIDARSPILVAEFEASEADRELARAMTEAFRIDFSQTRIVRLMEPPRISEALRRMQVDPATPLTIDVARRLARREGVPAVIGGSFSRVPGGFVLTGRIEDAGGAVLVSHRETAADSSQVLAAIDALSEKLRERLGESFTSLRADEPLERVTTSSLRALELYTEAIRTIEYEADDEAGIRLLEEALAEDPEFASAWRKLGVVVRNIEGSPTRVEEAMTRAFELRERLTPRERYLTEAAYYERVISDRPRAISVYERLLDLDPNDPWALNNLAVLYGEEGDRERSLELTARAVEVDTSAVSLGNLAQGYLTVRRIEEADSTAQLFRRLFPDDYRAGLVAALVEVHREDLVAAEEIARTAVERSDGVAQLWNLWSLVELLTTTGRLAEADRLAVRAARTAAELGFPAPEYDLAFHRFWTRISMFDDRRAARAELERTLAATPLENLEPLDRPYMELALAYAHLGDRARAEEMIDAFRKAVPDAPPARYEITEAIVEGDLAFAEQRWDDAIAAYEEARRLQPGCAHCQQYSIAHAHERADRPDSALALFEQIIDMSGTARLRVRSYMLGPALERIAQIHDEQGRFEEAAAHYVRFADLWADADAELQPRVAAARARAEEIVRVRG